MRFHAFLEHLIVPTKCFSLTCSDVVVVRRLFTQLSRKCVNKISHCHTLSYSSLPHLTLGERCMYGAVVSLLVGQ